MIAENHDLFLADFGVPCSAGAFAFTALLDTPDEQLNMAGINVLSTMYRLTCKSADVAAGGIASGAAITAAGAAYTVRDVVLQDDGVFAQLTLSK